MKFYENSFEHLHEIFKSQTDFPEYDSKKPYIFSYFQVRINSEGNKNFSIHNIGYPYDLFCLEDYTFLGFMKAPPVFPWFVNNKTLEQYPEIIDFDKTVDEIFNKVVPK